MRGHEPISVILKAAVIPDGSTVSKVTGEKQYILKRSIKLYGSDQKEVIPDPNTVFLISEGSVNQYPNSTKLLWITTIDNLNSLIDEGDK
jgi:hypothetical protein